MPIIAGGLANRENTIASAIIKNLCESVVFETVDHSIIGNVNHGW
jgi:hypothetical protein